MHVGVRTKLIRLMVIGLVSSSGRSRSVLSRLAKSRHLVCYSQDKEEICYMVHQRLHHLWVESSTNNDFWSTLSLKLWNFCLYTPISNILTLIISQLACRYPPSFITTRYTPLIGRNKRALTDIHTQREINGQQFTQIIR